MERWRCETFWTKEPETIQWMAGFRTGGVFFEIGANIGIYSLFIATMNPRIKVYAIEPMIRNYIRMVENINLNQSNNIVPFNIALGAATFIEKFYIPNAEAGASGGQIYYPIDDKGEEFNPIISYDMITFALDDLIDKFYLPIPNYTRLTLMGIELAVIDGMRETLKQNEVQTMLIEFNGGESIKEEFLRDMNSYGF